MLPIRTTELDRLRGRKTQLAGAALDQQGNLYARRDAVDERIIDQVRNESGRVIDDPAEVGGWPLLDVGSPAQDSDHDGMPDVWEDKNNLDKTNSDDRNNIDSDGYTMLEKYLNSIR